MLSHLLVRLREMREITQDYKSCTICTEAVCSVVDSASYMIRHPLTQTAWDLQSQNSSSGPDHLAAAPTRQLPCLRVSV